MRFGLRKSQNNLITLRLEDSNFNPYLSTPRPPDQYMPFLFFSSHFTSLCYFLFVRFRAGNL